MAYQQQICIPAGSCWYHLVLIPALAGAAQKSLLLLKRWQNVGKKKFLPTFSVSPGISRPIPGCRYPGTGIPPRAGIPFGMSLLVSHTIPLVWYDRIALVSRYPIPGV